MKRQTFARSRRLAGVAFYGAGGSRRDASSFGEMLTFVLYAGTCADLVYQISKRTIRIRT